LNCAARPFFGRVGTSELLGSFAFSAIYTHKKGMPVYERKSSHHTPDKAISLFLSE